MRSEKKKNKRREKGTRSKKRFAQKITKHQKKAFISLGTFVNKLCSPQRVKIQPGAEMTVKGGMKRASGTSPFPSPRLRLRNATAQ